MAASAPSSPAVPIAISGASGKTGYRIAEEAVARGWAVRLLVRPGSELPESLSAQDIRRLDFGDPAALEAALEGCGSLVIATGARPSPDLLGPLKVDAFGVRRQVEACRAAGVGRVLLVSSLCSGRLFHPLNLFGLILIWKRIGEQALETSGLDWTVIRPGGLREQEDRLEQEGLVLSGRDTQQDRSIPRRLVARCCLDALQHPASIGRVLEITSRSDAPGPGFAEALAALA
ncbi:SDR family oxidoreductase [Synechococcus sp. RSCCF101]|uniref:SDR family oxidoreductase n=1 Tax=Synechococcus sp. RSCCF101 TaxID=2511069 RepID=UPI001248A456|nr:SDR family oxidoreductase [Synechococcus sp. RSCCF101]QEY31067.1 SDR family oxidoreductase [Synechococcus sp. RSCCF101]